MSSRFRAGLVAMLVLAGTALGLFGATALWSVGNDHDPGARRVNVRWSADVDDSSRQELERTFGLREPEFLEGRTWRYRLSDHSRGAIERIVTSPRVEDTLHIDRSEYRLAADELPPVVSLLVERELWKPGAAVLAALSLVPLFLARRALAGLARTATAGTMRLRGRVAVRLARHETAATLAVVGCATALALATGISGRPEDSTFVHLYETPSILAGDRPYRDFFEWGAPLPAYLSAAVQVLVGYRVVGEVLLQGAFIVAGMVMAFGLALRACRSCRAVLALLPIALLVLLWTPTYHYSKLFCFPAGLWLAWRYLERPGRRNAVSLGSFVAIAFLFRHDYVLWVGLAAASAFVLSPLAASPPRPWPLAVRDAALGAGASVLVVAPFFLAVATGEGVGAYVEARSQQYEASERVLRRAVGSNPLNAFRPRTLPPPRVGHVGFRWREGVDDDTKARLLSELAITYRGPGDDGRDEFDVANVFDLRLLELNQYISADNGFEWDLLTNVRDHKVARTDAVQLLVQAALLVPAGLMLGGVTRWWHAGNSPHARIVAVQRFHAGLFLLLTDVALFRQETYIVTTAPLSAAFGAALLAHGDWTSARRSITFAVRLLRVVAVVVAAAATGAALIAAGGPAGLVEQIREFSEQAASRIEVLTASPPVARGYEEYLRACTRPGDHLLVTGVTPFYINYYTTRPLAGGHLYWHSRYRRSPEQQRQSLALLERQPVPFAVSSGDPVIGDITRTYPQIADYLQRHYREVPGTDGKILVDSRRTPSGTFGAKGWPCFAPGDRGGARHGE